MGSWEENVLSGAYSSPMPVSDECPCFDDCDVDEPYVEEDLIDEIH